MPKILRGNSAILLALRLLYRTASGETPGLAAPAFRWGNQTRLTQPALWVQGASEQTSLSCLFLGEFVFSICARRSPSRGGIRVALRRDRHAWRTSPGNGCTTCSCGRDHPLGYVAADAYSYPRFQPKARLRPKASLDAPRACATSRRPGRSALESRRAKAGITVALNTSNTPLRCSAGATDPPWTSCVMGAGSVFRDLPVRLLRSAHIDSSMRYGETQACISRYGETVGVR